MIKSLQSVRFLMAMLIFHHHFYTNPQVVQFGVFPVAFFFMLSGFLMGVGYADRVSSPEFSFRQFMRRRLIRIMPLNVTGLIFTMLVTAAIGIVRFNPRLGVGWMLIPDLFLFQSWIPIERVYFSGNAVAWFLSDMLFCYMMFPFICKILRRSMKPCIIVLVLYFIAVSHIPEHRVHAFVYISPAFRVVDFMLGVCLYVYFSKCRSCIHRIQELSALNRTVIEALPFAFAVLSLAVYPYVPTRFSYASLYWIPSAVFIFVFAVMAGNGGGISRMLGITPLRYLGNLSFAFYIFHLTIVRLYNTIEAHFATAPAGRSVAGAFVCIIMTVVAACLYNRYIEPFILKRINVNQQQ